MDEQFSPITDILKSPAFQSFASETATITLPEEAQPNPQTAYTPQTHIITQHLLELRARIDALLTLLNENTVATNILATKKSDLETIEPQNGTVIEGVFDGQHMIDADGKQYNIPANYASKSKLVEGDMMKLTITPSGAYVYKQITPTPRRRLIGTVMYDEHTRLYGVHAENKLYKVLKASITFYQLTHGSNVAILIPQDSPSHWAAIDNAVNM